MVSARVYNAAVLSVQLNGVETWTPSKYLECCVHDVESRALKTIEEVHWFSILCPTRCSARGLLDKHPPRHRSAPCSLSQSRPATRVIYQFELLSAYDLAEDVVRQDLQLFNLTLKDVLSRP